MEDAFLTSLVRVSVHPRTDSRILGECNITRKATVHRHIALLRMNKTLARHMVGNDNPLTVRGSVQGSSQGSH